jgi:hypothetical protein
MKRELPLAVRELPFRQDPVGDVDGNTEHRRSLQVRMPVGNLYRLEPSRRPILPEILAFRYGEGHAGLCTRRSASRSAAAFSGSAP